jgi:hypothetical protein
MTIWILAIVLVMATVSAGYAQGAIRAACSLLGIVAGVFLMMPLAPTVMPLLPFFGITSSWTKAVVAPIVAFVLVGIAFKIGGAFLHRKIEYHYKYRVSDGHRALWERMNRRVGAALGSIGGAIYFVMVCLLVSTLGYFTLQLGATETNSTTLRLFTRMAEDVRSTRMDKVVGGMNPAPESYYDMCDFVGFLMQNRDVFKRIRSYPPIYALGSAQYLEGDPEKGRLTPFRSIVDDNDYFRMLGAEQDPSVILDHARTQEMMTNTEVRAFLAGLDVKDLTAFLKTGKAPKYADERILGNWVYDFPASYALAKTERPSILASEMIRTRKELEERFNSATLVATLDNVISLKLPPRMENTAVPGLSNAPPRVSYTGRWRRSGAGYALDIHPRNGQRVDTSEAVVQKAPTGRSGREVERLAFKIDQKVVCFDRVPD